MQGGPVIVAVDMIRNETKLASEIVVKLKSYLP
jgi:hypothetical protein